MRFSTYTLQAAKQFGSAILSGAIFNDPSSIAELYNHFINKSENTIIDFVDFIGKFLSNEQLFQLVEHLLSHEGHHQRGGILRISKSLCKYLFAYELRRYYSYNEIINALKSPPLNHQQILDLISLPEVVLKHFKSQIVPIIVADGDVKNKAEGITNAVLFAVFHTPVSKLLMDTAESQTDLQHASNLVSVFKDLLNVPTPNSSACVYLDKITEMRIRIYQAIDQCLLPQEVVIVKSDPFSIEKLNKLTDALLKLVDNEAAVVDDEKLNAVMLANDANVLAFTLQKLEPVSMLGGWRAYFFPASTTPSPEMNSQAAPAMSSAVPPDISVGTLSSVKASILNMGNIKEHDSIDNIRSRFIALVSSIKALINTGSAASNQAMKTSSIMIDESEELPGHQEYTLLREKLTQFGKLTSLDLRLLHANGICSLTNDLRININSFKSKLPDTKEFKQLHECLQSSLENIAVFEDSCQRSNNTAAVDDAKNSLQPSLGTS